MDLYLSSKSLKYIKESGLEEDIELIILDDRIKCSKFVGCFLSPKISKAIRSDPTITQYRVQFPERTNYYSGKDELRNLLKRTNFVQQLKSIIDGGPFHIELSEEQAKGKVYETDAFQLLSEFCYSIENYELIEKVLEYSEDIEITNSNLNEVIKFNRKHFNTNIYQRIIDFSAKKFYLITSTISEDDQKEKIPKNIKFTYEELVDIISSNQLQIENEDSLFEYITGLGSEFFSLLDYIEVQYLSSENIKKMIDIISDEDFKIHPKLWSSIYRRLILDPKEKHVLKNPRQILRAEKIAIISHISDEKNANPYECGAICVETSKINDGKIQNLFDKSKDTHFRLDNQPNGYIVIDFKDIKINFSKYCFSVPSRKNGQYTGRPKSWTIEGSNDKITWSQIDSKENIICLNDFENRNIFSCTNQNDNFYRYIKINEKIDTSNSHFFLLSELEFYGFIE